MSAAQLEARISAIDAERHEQRAKRIAQMVAQGLNCVVIAQRLSLSRSHVTRLVKTLRQPQGDTHVRP